MRERRRTLLRYRDGSGAESDRPVRPLALSFYPPVWLLIAWCELRCDFRSFRLDRTLAVEVLDQTFPVEPGQALADFLAQMEAEEAGEAAQSSP